MLLSMCMNWLKMTFFLSILKNMRILYLNISVKCEILGANVSGMELGKIAVKNGMR